MTDQEFETAIAHQIQVINLIDKILRENWMSLSASNGSIWLCDDGRDIGNTGYFIRRETA